MSEYFQHQEENKMNEPKWYEEAAGFFGPDYLTEYGGRLTDGATAKEIDFIRMVIEIKSYTKASILDVPCGHGRHANRLAENKRISVTGYELNEFFLTEAKKAWGNSNCPVTYVQGDMRELPFKEEFDVVLNLFTAMGYFDDDSEDEKFFAGVYRALKPGGKFMIDFINQGWLIKNFKPKDWVKLPNGSDLLIERRFDYTEGYSNDFRTFIRLDGTVAKQALRHRVYAPHELIAMAKRTGLSFIKSYSDFEDKPLTVDSKRMILIFEKK